MNEFRFIINEADNCQKLRYNVFVGPDRDHVTDQANLFLMFNANYLDSYQYFEAGGVVALMIWYFPQ